jgi:uncharacterized protein
MRIKAIILRPSKSILMETEYQIIREIVEKELSGSHHDIEHIARVYNLCLHLAEHESNVDLHVLKTAALLHDIARVKEFQDKTGKVEHAALGAEIAEEILRKLGYSKEEIGQVKHCIFVHRYRRNRGPLTIEARILFDADKLDALGAIGVARSFMMAGHFGQRIYSDVPIEDYLRENVVGGRLEGGLRNVSKHAPNLEYELKFKNLPKRLYTKKGTQMARDRLQFMESFFHRLRTELQGDS